MKLEIEIELPMNGKDVMVAIEIELSVRDEEIECYGWSILADIIPTSLQEQLIDKAIDNYIEKYGADIVQNHKEALGDDLYDRWKDEQ